MLSRRRGRGAGLVPPRLFCSVAVEHSGRFAVSPADGAPSNEDDRKQQQRSAIEELASARKLSYRASSQTPTPAPSVPSASGAGTPVPRICETPGSTGSEHSSTFLSEANVRDISAFPRGSIPGGEKGM